MANFEIIMSLIAGVVGFIFSTIAFAVKFFKSHSAKTAAEHKLEIGDVLLGFICEAETMSTLSGAEKKQFVLERVEAFARSNGLTYGIATISTKIDQIIALSRLVNFGKTN